MNTTRQIRKADIGKFRSVDDAQVYKKMQGVQKEVEEARDIFRSQDNQASDMNLDVSNVLLDDYFVSENRLKDHRLSGFLSESETAQTDFDATASYRRKALLGGFGLTTVFSDKEMSLHENESEIRWMSMSVSGHSGKSERTRKHLEVVEDKATGVISLIEHGV